MKKWARPSDIQILSSASLFMMKEDYFHNHDHNDGQKDSQESLRNWGVLCKTSNNYQNIKHFRKQK